MGLTSYSRRSRSHVAHDADAVASKQTAHRRPWVAIVVTVLVTAALAAQVALIHAQKKQDADLAWLTTRIMDLESTRAASFQPNDPNEVHPVAQGGVMMPGFVVRVYEPSAAKDANESPDVGTFVLSEPTFPMSIHRDYSIEISGAPVYRLNAMYLAKRPGAHQFKISFDYNEPTDRPQQWIGVTRLPECDAKVAVAGQLLLDSKVSFEDERAGHLWAGTDLSAGVHAIELLLHCDSQSVQDRVEMERAINVRLETRDPYENRSVARADSFWYKAAGVTDAATVTPASLREVSAEMTGKDAPTRAPGTTQ